MSTVRNSSVEHRRADTHQGNNHYSITRESGGTSQLTIATSRISRRSSAMGGMVSAISAVLCGTGRRQQEEDMYTEKLTVSPNGLKKLHDGQNGTSVHLRPSTETRLSVPHTGSDRDSHSQGSSIYQTPRGSDTDYSDAREREYLAEACNMPYMDESDPSEVSGNSELSLIMHSVALAHSNKLHHKVKDRPDISETESLDGTHAAVDISEGEYSADEEQDDELESVESEDEVERADSESEGEQSADEHACHTDCDHSEYELSDESEAASEDDEEHVCDSECEHSTQEDDVELSDQSEYDSEDDNSHTSEHEAINISETEHSCDEDQQSDSEEEMVVCECDSDCPSDCDGYHHDCSSQCDCDTYQSDSSGEHELESKEATVTDNASNAHVSPTPAVRVNDSLPPSVRLSSTNRTQPFKVLNHQNSLPALQILSEITPQSKASLKPTERNNNRIQRNYSQRIPQRGNIDMIGELKTAIDARVRRTASCRETATDYRKRYAHLSSNEHDIVENYHKLDVNATETRRKERRTRLRTLELKREQCLDDIRDGTEENVTDRLYQDTNTQKTAKT